jgi:hypothetical protein
MITAKAEERRWSAEGGAGEENENEEQEADRTARSPLLDARYCCYGIR